MVSPAISLDGKVNLVFIVESNDEPQRKGLEAQRYIEKVLPDEDHATPCRGKR